MIQHSLAVPHSWAAQITHEVHFQIQSLCLYSAVHCVMYNTHCACVFSLVLGTMYFVQNRGARKMIQAYCIFRSGSRKLYFLMITREVTSIPGIYLYAVHVAFSIIQRKITFSKCLACWLNSW